MDERYLSIVIELELVLVLGASVEKATDLRLSA